MSETMSAEDVVRILNFHLGILSEVILESFGMVVSYIGDAVMALWNAPYELPDHRLRADAGLRPDQRSPRRLSRTRASRFRSEGCSESAQLN